MYRIIGTDRKEYGPVTADQLRKWFAEGRVNGNTLARLESELNWRPLSSFPEFSGLFGTAAAPGPGTPPTMQPGVPRPEVSSYLVPAIFATICCCLPFGVAGIVYAAQASSKLQAGDYQGAVNAAGKARMWTWLAIISGLVLSVGYLILAAALNLA